MESFIITTIVSYYYIAYTYDSQLISDVRECGYIEFQRRCDSVEGTRPHDLDTNLIQQFYELTLIAATTAGCLFI